MLSRNAGAPVDTWEPLWHSTIRVGFFPHHLALAQKVYHPAPANHSSWMFLRTYCHKESSWNFHIFHFTFFYHYGFSMLFTQPFFQPPWHPSGSSWGHPSPDPLRSIVLSYKPQEAPRHGGQGSLVITDDHLSQDNPSARNPPCQDVKDSSRACAWTYELGPPKNNMMYYINWYDITSMDHVNNCGDQRLMGTEGFHNKVLGLERIMLSINGSENDACNWPTIKHY